MTKLVVDTDKYGYQSEFAVVEAYNSAVKDLMRQRIAAAGKPWRDYVFGDAAAVLTKADMEAIEARLLALGYRFAPSAMSSAIERPEA